MVGMEGEIREQPAREIQQKIQKLRNGLHTIAVTNSRVLSDEECARCVESTLEEVSDRWNQIMSNPTGFARALLLGNMMELLLGYVKKGDMKALEDLVVLLDVRLKDDPQFSRQRWGSEIDHDLLQDARMVFTMKVEESVQDNPYLYFRRIILNKIQDKIALRRRDQARRVQPGKLYDSESDQGPLETYDIPFDAGIERKVENRDFIDRILRAVRQLSDFCQSFFIAMYQGYNETEWRKRTRTNRKMTEAALNTRIHRCRHSLRKILQQWSG